VTLVLPGWRFWLAFGGIGCAGAFGYLGEWEAVAVATVAGLLPVAWWVRGELAATRVMLGGSGRHRGHGLRNAAAALRAAARIPLP
jgi:hypothetical protein